MSLHLSSLFDVKGKIALVTGGGSGLGEMMATTLVHNGAHAYIASRKEKQLKEVSDRLNKEGPGKCEYIIADLGNAEGCKKLVEEVKKRTQKLHILVNNSGTTWGAAFDNFPEKEGWLRVMGTNVQAPFYLTAGLAPLLAKDANNIDPGRVIIISSVAGISSSPYDSGLSDDNSGLWSYNASKAAANSLTKNLATTLGSKFVTVNAILPGIYPSKMTKFGMSKHGDKMAESHPMGRVGTPEDLAGLLLFLCGRSGAHISGQLIATDGGASNAGRGYSKI